MLDLVTEDVVAEHARDPRGNHSPALQEVLRFLRRAQLPHGYVVVAVEPWRDYRVGTLVPLEKDPSRVAPRIDGERAFASDAAAMHEVFLRRVQDLRHLADAERTSA